MLGPHPRWCDLHGKKAKWANWLEDKFPVLKGKEGHGSVIWSVILTKDKSFQEASDIFKSTVGHLIKPN